MFTIKAKKRDKDVKLDTLKNTGEIPAVFYGVGQVATSIAIPIVEFKKIWRQAGESRAIQILTVGGNIDVLIHDVQVHPVSNEPIHVDFLAIDMLKKITVDIPLVFTGISNAVKAGLGTLVKVLHEIEIEALPKDLPQNITVDISKLNTIDDVILVSDIILPKDVTLVTKGSDIVASVAEQIEEKEETPAVDLSSIQVEKKGKKDEDGTTDEQENKKE